ncbi:GntR family transcriptional regulator [Actinomycetospora sp.]|uniref:GntR family transcriptional regulator n=1 Tax=Actinomycetospora sp. TaxID=1872135 RepID=UPI002F40C361
MRVDEGLTAGMTVRRTTTAQQVADGLAERILDGRIAPGARLRESAIATDLKIARPTVREAVRMLELRGLVRYEVNRGAVVISPTPQELATLYAARAELEVAAVASPRPPEAIARVRAALEDLSRAAATHDPELIVERDLAFHAALVGMLGARRLDDFYAQLTQELRVYLLVLSVSDREYEHSDAVVAEHSAIVEALDSGDPDHAAAVVRHHVEANAARLTEILTRST